jgi:hypothetical protein
MKHFVLGYPDPARKGAVTVLYAGDSRADARQAMFEGGAGIAVTDYICNPQVSQSRRHRSRTALSSRPPAPAPKGNPPPPEITPEEPLETAPLPLPKKARPRPPVAPPEE